MSDHKPEEEPRTSSASVSTAPSTSASNSDGKAENEIKNSLEGAAGGGGGDGPAGPPSGEKMTAEGWRRELTGPQVGEARAGQASEVVPREGAGTSATSAEAQFEAEQQPTASSYQAQRSGAREFPERGSAGVVAREAGWKEGTLTQTAIETQKRSFAGASAPSEEGGAAGEADPCRALRSPLEPLDAGGRGHADGAGSAGRARSNKGAISDSVEENGSVGEKATDDERSEREGVGTTRAKRSRDDEDALFFSGGGGGGRGPPKIRRTVRIEGPKAPDQELGRSRVAVTKKPEQLNEAGAGGARKRAVPEGDVSGCVKSQRPGSIGRKATDRGSHDGHGARRAAGAAGGKAELPTTAGKKRAAPMAAEAVEAPDGHPEKEPKRTRRAGMVDGGMAAGSECAEQDRRVQPWR